MALARTIFKNTLSNWAGAAVSTLVTILMTPYLLTHLGKERYGIYQIVLPIVMYTVLLEFGLSGAINRFSSRYIAGKDYHGLNCVISMICVFGLAIGIIIIGLCFAFGFLLQGYFHISEQFFFQTLWMFVGLGVNTVFSFLCYGFAGVLIGYNRFELVNVRLLIGSIGSAILVYLFFSMGWVSLTSWAISIILASFAGLVFTIAAAKIVHKPLYVSPVYLNTKIIREMFGFSAWNMLIQLAYFLLFNTNNIIIGRLLGPESVPMYAIPFMLVARLQDVAAGMTSTLSPIASAAVVNGDNNRLGWLLQKGTFVSAAIVLPVGTVLLVMCKGLFRVWLPPGFENSWIVFVIIMCGMFFSVTQTTSYHVLLGGGNIKGIGISYMSCAVIAIALSFYFIKYHGLGIYGAAIGLVIPNFLLMGVFQAWYSSNQVGLNFIKYVLHSYSKPFAIAAPSVIISVLLSTFIPPGNLLKWFVEFAVSLFPAGIIVFICLTTGQQRASLYHKIGFNN